MIRNHTLSTSACRKLSRAQNVPLININSILAGKKLLRGVDPSKLEEIASTVSNSDSHNEQP